MDTNDTSDTNDTNDTNVASVTSVASATSATKPIFTATASKARHYVVRYSLTALIDSALFHTPPHNL